MPVRAAQLNIALPAIAADVRVSPDWELAKPSRQTDSAQGISRSSHSMWRATETSIACLAFSGMTAFQNAP